MFESWFSWWDVRQDGQIANNRSRTGEVSARVSTVDDKLERLMLVNAALWELIRDSTSLSDDDLKRKIQEIDLRDGKLDGKMSSSPSSCKDCGRTIGRRHHKCIYCGAPAGGSPIR